MRWQKRARFVIAAGALAFAIAVALTLGRRPTPRVEPPLARSDPEAVIESAGGQTFRLNKEKEEVRIKYDKLLSYANGASKMLGLQVVTERAGGRIFTITGREGEVTDNESNVSVTGDVRIRTNDGLEIATDRATYTEADRIVRAPGPVQFSRGRMTGSGFGLTYDEKQNLVTIFDRAAVRVAPDESGAGAMEMTAGTLQFQRTEHVVRLDKMMKATREREVIEAESAVAHLSEDEERLQALELRGNSRITATGGGVGGLQALSGHAIDLTYGPDGQAIQRAVITGTGLIQLAGETGQAGRQIAAHTIDLGLAPDGTTPKSLAARDNVRLTIPAGKTEPARTIAAQTLDSSGDDQHGLTGAHFGGNVQFTERGSDVTRTAKSAMLDLSLSQGFNAIEEARFAGGVRFADSEFTATAAAARYAIVKGVLALSGTAPDFPRPHVVSAKLTVDAAQIDVTLGGPHMLASGNVKSVIVSAREGTNTPARRQHETRMPSMLEEDQPVNVTANDLTYDGAASRAVYTGNAQLWQGDTSIKASAITVDNNSGDLTAVGPVTTTTVVLQEKNGKKERVRSIGSAASFKYEEAERRATYAGDAHLSGPQGDTTAGRIELYLTSDGEEVERAEAYDTVTLRDQSRKTTGNRLTYRSADESYVVTGTPVSVFDECGRETLSRTLTFFRTSDRIIVDGNEQVRTQTKGKSSCP